MSVEITLYTLIITHRHGRDISIHTDEDKATQWLYEYVAEQWTDKEIEGDTPDNPEDCIEQYFEQMNMIESWEIISLPVDYFDLREAMKGKNDVTR